MNQTLIVTAQKELIKSVNNIENIVFLGEWAKSSIPLNDSRYQDVRVLDYHWSNRDKYNKDYVYLDNLYEKILVSISRSLNSIHSLDKSIRFWRIIIGPWLSSFIQINYDRWAMLEVAQSDINIKKVNLFSIKDNNVIPNNDKDFTRLFVNDYWNHWLYSEIIKYRGLFKIINVEGIKHESNKNKGPIFIEQFRRFFLIFNPLIKFFSKSKSFFIYNIQSSLFKKIILEFRLLEFPSIGKFPDYLLKFNEKINHNKRDQLLVDDFPKNDFEKFLTLVIPKQIPKSYIESFNEIIEISRKMPWPLNPKVIITNLSQDGDVLKFWIATKIDMGSLLYIGQHGGHYGASKISSVEKHERKIADIFLSWGWKDKGVYPLSSYKLNSNKLNIKKSRKKKCVVIQNVTPRYSYLMFSSVVSSLQVKYFEQQFDFVEGLNSDIRKQLSIRPFPSDYGWQQNNRWKNRFTDIELDISSSYSKSISNAKIVIATYNATTFLETFSANIPTLIFWDSSMWELNSKSKYFFDILEDAGILFYDPVLAAKKLNTIWINIDEWWGSDEVTRAVKLFSKEYAQKPDNILKEWSLYLSSLNN